MEEQSQETARPLSQDWLSSRAGARPADPGELDVERLRTDLDAHAAKGKWEASTLKAVADLLDSLELARKEQEMLARRLAEAGERTASSEAGLERAREERDALAARLESTDPELSRLRGELQTALDRIGKLEQERDEARAASETERKEWNTALEKVRAEQAAMQAMAERLETVSRERDILAEGVSEWEAERTRTQTRVEALRRECAQLKRASEQSLVELCDLRVQANRLEQERDDARREQRHRIKKILGKVHAALDEAGAPRGDDLSFGERIRGLRARLDS